MHIVLLFIDYESCMHNYVYLFLYMQYKKKMNNWKKADDTQCFEFEYNFFHDIKVTLDLQNYLAKNWNISAQSPLEVYKPLL